MRYKGILTGFSSLFTDLAQPWIFIEKRINHQFINSADIPLGKLFLHIFYNMSSLTAEIVLNVFIVINMILINLVNILYIFCVVF